MGIITITVPRRKAKPAERVIIRARSTQDAFSLASLYDDLANRLTQAWVDLNENEDEGKTQDEKEGHEFHGNQYVDVPGSPKPTTTVAKIAKHAVHELLSSGHPFTIEELGAITGHANPKTLAAWMTMFKSPKYAGPKGVLDIKKLPDGSYQVIKPDGEPAPANPKLAEVKEANAKVKKEQGDPSEMKPPKGYVPTQVKAPVKMEEPGNAAELEAAIKQADPSVEAVHHVTGGAITVPKEPITQAEADTYYQENLTEAQGALADTLANGTPTAEVAKALVLSFKEEKALFMAQWKTNTTGKFHEPKKQEQVFEADKKLVDDLVAAANLYDPMEDPVGHGHEVKKAFDAWKANTKLEKMGKFGVKAPEPVKAAKKEPTNSQPVTASNSLVAHPVAPIAYDQLVPKDYEHIGEDDFNTTKAKFSTGIFNTKQILMAQGGDSVANKKTVEVKLRERLKAAPNFTALRAAMGDHAAAAGLNSLEARLVATWAGSSGGANPLSNAMQLAVQEAFSIPEAHVTKTQLKVVKAHGNNDLVYQAGAKHLGLTEDLAKKHLEVFKKGLQEFAHAQYHETQDLLKSQGIEHMYLARGMKISSDEHKEIVNGPVQLKLQPASSFSVNYSTAKNFGGAGTVFLTKVPRSQILSTYLTGFGCSSEHEVVVIAHENLKSYGVAAKEADTAKSAAEIVASKIKQKAKVAA